MEVAGHLVAFVLILLARSQAWDVSGGSATLRPSEWVLIQVEALDKGTINAELQVWIEGGESPSLSTRQLQGGMGKIMAMPLPDVGWPFQRSFVLDGPQSCERLLTSQQYLDWGGSIPVGVQDKTGDSEDSYEDVYDNATIHFGLSNSHRRYIWFILLGFCWGPEAVPVDATSKVVLNWRLQYDEYSEGSDNINGDLRWARTCTGLTILLSVFVLLHQLRPGVEVGLALCIRCAAAVDVCAAGANLFHLASNAADGGPQMSPRTFLMAATALDIVAYALRASAATANTLAISGAKRKVVVCRTQICLVLGIGLSFIAEPWATVRAAAYAERARVCDAPRLLAAVPALAFWAWLVARLALRGPSPTRILGGCSLSLAMLGRHAHGFVFNFIPMHVRVPLGSLFGLALAVATYMALIWSIEGRTLSSICNWSPLKVSAQDV